MDKGRKDIELYLLKLNEETKNVFQLRGNAPIQPISVPETKSDNVEHAVPVSTQGKVTLIASTGAPKISLSKDTFKKSLSPLEKLNCPSSSLVTYWRESKAEDNAYVSPFNDRKRPKNSMLTEKYITFEPDVGGWNNIRMQMEVVLVFAAVTGRTLVIPPEQAMVRMFILCLLIFNLYLVFT
jgi:hypothetical protein